MIDRGCDLASRCQSSIGADMHEMGIAMQIVEIATSAIPKEAEGTPVEVVNLKVDSG